MINFQPLTMRVMNYLSHVIHNSNLCFFRACIHLRLALVVFQENNQDSRLALTGTS